MYDDDNMQYITVRGYQYILDNDQVIHYTADCSKVGVHVYLSPDIGGHDLCTECMVDVICDVPTSIHK